jgi:hypothetical protein
MVGRLSPGVAVVTGAVQYWNELAKFGTLLGGW